MAHTRSPSLPRRRLQVNLRPKIVHMKFQIQTNELLWKPLFQQWNRSPIHYVDVMGTIEANQDRLSHRSRLRLNQGGFESEDGLQSREGGNAALLIPRT